MRPAGMGQATKQQQTAQAVQEDCAAGSASDGQTAALETVDGAAGGASGGPTGAASRVASAGGLEAGDPGQRLPSAHLCSQAMYMSGDIGAGPNRGVATVPRPCTCGVVLPPPPCQGTLPVVCSAASHT